MDEDQETVADRSIAGLSAADEGSAGRALGVATGARYEEIAVVGEGGLGTVLRAHDRFLGRDVALKRIRGHVQSGSPVEIHDRFLHEARITARLDHPNIVPVHDAGVTDDGRMFYTMRLIRGRSLAELAADARTLDARLALLGPLIAACQAIGYAHRHGVIHRDLKPANIMIGDLGETQVIDWGLAQVLAEREPSGSFAGTYPYASPEVLRGEPHGIAADVWAIGVTLHEVIAGVHRFPGSSKSDIERRVCAVPLPRADWPADCPPELITIGERAMASAPGDRYADARELALDLEAFRDGRRVAAHRYSRLELLRRFVVAWRWPIAAAATLAIGTIGALAFTNHRTEAQRRRAVTAEAAARQELDRTEAALSDALAARAVVSLEQGAIADAELGAVAALEHGEHPDARGVLAATQLAPHPQSAVRVSIPGCPRVVATGTSSALCVKRDEVTAWEIDATGPHHRWTRDVRLDHAVSVGDAWLVAWSADHVFVLASDTGEEHARVALAGRVAGVQRALTGERVVVHDRSTVIAVGADGVPQVTERACGSKAAVTTVDAVATSDTTTWVVCTGGEIGTLGERGFMLAMSTGFGTEVSAASALAVSESGHDAAIGTTAGDIFMLDMRGCMSSACEAANRFVTFPGTGTVIRHIAVLGGSELVAIDEHGTAIHLRRGSIGELSRIPIDPGSPPFFLEAGSIVAGGAQLSRWQIDTAAAPAVLRHHRGIVAVAISADRSVAAALTDDSELVMWDARTGILLSNTSVRGARSVALSADGTHATVVAGAEATTYATASGEIVTRSSVVGETSESSLRTSAHLVSLAGWDLELADAEVSYAVLAEDGRYLAIGTSTGRIELWDPTRRRLVARLRGHVQRVTWLAFDRDRLWSAGLDGRLRAWALAPLETPISEAMGRSIRERWGE